MWNMTIRVGFQVRCGVRQGGVLSPFLFDIYIDDIIVQMRSQALVFGLAVYLQVVYCMPTAMF